ncbi:MAG: amidase domain-containing protein, partial [Bacteroidales bacterium]|nr:amidase domain-containing protein [Bacteroidales bacterium]
MRQLILILNVFLLIISGFAQTYNPEAAAAYATRYCNTPNEQYPYYNSDCANFVSQCLKAGGLDLSVGINPNLRPPNNGVNGYDCMDNAQNLTYHLEHYQNTENNVVTGFNTPANHDVGDPVFVLENKRAVHSFICSSLDNSASYLYSSHSSEHCDVNISSWYPNTQLKFFHIKNSIPAHCENCIKDADETGIDCGGSCPPCQ